MGISGGKFIPSITEYNFLKTSGLLNMNNSENTLLLWFSFDFTDLFSCKLFFENSFVIILSPLFVNGTRMKYALMEKEKYLCFFISG